MFVEWENNSGKLQIIIGKFQNNAINDVKQISLSHVINERNFNLIISSSCLFSSNMGIGAYLDQTQTIM